MTFSNGLQTFSSAKVYRWAILIWVAIATPATAAPDANAAKKQLAPLTAVAIPKDNPQTLEKIALGRMLFFDPRLAGDSSMSCAKCHNPAKGWSNGLQLSDAYPGTKHWRHTPTVLNAAYLKHLFWDGRAGSLEEQCTGPIEAPIEMNQNFAHLVEKLNGIPYYKTSFQKVFHSEITMKNLAKAIASFERTIVSRPGPIDRYLQGDKNALTESQRRGMAIFNGKAGCIRCHSGPLMTDNAFHVTGTPEIDPLKKETDRIATRHFFAKVNQYPNPRSVDSDYGLELITKSRSDRGKFKTPSLRELRWTAPYMHNGAFEMLEDVIEFYMRGGGKHPNKDPLLKRFDLTDQEFGDLLNFLEALSSDKPLLVKKPDLPKKADGTF